MVGTVEGPAGASSIMRTDSREEDRMQMGIVMTMRKMDEAIA
jgi:hypothetical protein